MHTQTHTHCTVLNIHECSHLVPSLIPSHICAVYSTVFQQDVPKHSTNYVFPPHLIYSSLLSIRSFFNTRLLPSPHLVPWFITSDFNSPTLRYNCPLCRAYFYFPAVQIKKAHHCKSAKDTTPSRCRTHERARTSAAGLIALEVLCLFPSKLTSSKQGTKRQSQSMKFINENWNAFYSFLITRIVAHNWAGCIRLEITSHSYVWLCVCVCVR